MFNVQQSNIDPPNEKQIIADRLHLYDFSPSLAKTGDNELPLSLRQIPCCTLLLRYGTLTRGSQIQIASERISGWGAEAWGRGKAWVCAGVDRAPRVCSEDVSTKKWVWGEAMQVTTLGGRGNISPARYESAPRHASCAVDRRGPRSAHPGWRTPPSTAHRAHSNVGELTNTGN